MRPFLFCKVFLERAWQLWKSTLYPWLYDISVMWMQTGDLEIKIADKKSYDACNNKSLMWTKIPSQSKMCSRLIQSYKRFSKMLIWISQRLKWRLQIAPFVFPTVQKSKSCTFTVINDTPTFKKLVFFLKNHGHNRLLNYQNSWNNFFQPNWWITEEAGDATSQMFEDP